tara:strand:+ start:219446 stop:220000 length:555 start_codon:yes stop_codon:yes gene_type:complete
VRTIATLTFNLLFIAGIQFSPFSTADVAAETYVSTAPASGQSYYCEKCGKYHTRATSNVVPTSYTAPASRPVATNQSSSYSGGGMRNVLSMLNNQRARMGIAGLQYDSQLQAVAERRARKMASMGLKSHPPGSFSPGRYEGVGWSSSFSPSGVSACFTSDTRMRYAGAAMATGRDGVYFAVVYR